MEYSATAEKTAEQKPAVKKEKAVPYLAQRDVENHRYGIYIKNRSKPGKTHIQEGQNQEHIDKKVSYVIIKTTDLPHVIEQDSLDEQSNPAYQSQSDQNF